MKRFAISIFPILFCAALYAQAPEGFEIVDSLVYVPMSSVDSTLDGKLIYSVLPDNVSVNQSDELDRTLREHILSNEEKTVPCFRIRIFFDNKQNSREVSEETLRRFRALHPGVAAYRSFQNPFFKVTVGDYRSKSEALSAMESFKKEFPSAFIVKEPVRFPSIGNRDTWKVDTLKVLRSVEVF